MNLGMDLHDTRLDHYQGEIYTVIVVWEPAGSLLVVQILYRKIANGQETIAVHKNRPLRVLL